MCYFLSPLTWTLPTIKIFPSPQLIDFVITTHPAYPELQKLAKQQDKIHIVLADLLEHLRVQEAKAAKKDPNDFPLTELTKDLHMYPDLHGRFYHSMMHDTAYD